MKENLSKLNFKYVINVSSIVKSNKSNDLTLLNNYSNKKGIFVFAENNEIIYVGTSKNLKDRIAQCIRDENDTGSIKAVENLNDSEYERLLKSDIFVLTIEDFSKDKVFYSIFKKTI